MKILLIHEQAIRDSVFDRAQGFRLACLKARRLGFDLRKLFSVARPDRATVEFFAVLK